MKTQITLLLAGALLVLSAAVVSAQVFSVKSYKMTVAGSSSLHDWESSVEKAECKGYYTVSKNVLTELKDVVVKIEVESIKSTKGKMMDNKTYEAFRSEKNPNITFTMTGRQIGAGTITATGTLHMAGVSRPVDLILNYTILPNGNLQVKGKKKLLMSDFKMESPTAMMGTIKVGDEVEVAFEFTLAPNNSTI